MKKKLFILGIGFIILVLIQLISNLLVQKMNLSLPAPILGMVFLALLLYFKIIPEKLVRSVCEVLLKNMPLFFIPLFVGVMTYHKLIKTILTPILLIVFLTTFSTMLITGGIVEFIIRKTSPKVKEELK